MFEALKQRRAERKAHAKAVAEKQTPVHDYTDGRRGWGHDIGYKPVGGNRLDAHGWGHGLRVGHFILLSNGPATTRYVVETIRYCDDPTDMWFATLAFAPRGA